MSYSDRYTISGTVSGNDIIFDRNDGLTYSVDVRKYYGSFYDTNTQTNPTASIPMPMMINTIADSYETNNDGGTKVIFNKGGTYNIQFSAQFDKISGGKSDIDIWLRNNGVDVPWSNTRITLEGNNDKVVGAWNWIYTVGDGDDIEIMWCSASVDIRLVSFGTQSGPTRPAIPSLILTVLQI